MAFISHGTLLLISLGHNIICPFLDAYITCWQFLKPVDQLLNTFKNHSLAPFLQKILMETQIPIVCNAIITRIPFFLKISLFAAITSTSTCLHQSEHTSQLRPESKCHCIFHIIALWNHSDLTPRSMMTVLLSSNTHNEVMSHEQRIFRNHYFIHLEYHNLLIFWFLRRTAFYCTQHAYWYVLLPRPEPKNQVAGHILPGPLFTVWSGHLSPGVRLGPGVSGSCLIFVGPFSTCSDV